MSGLATRARILALLATVLVAGCSSPLPSTELPPARYISPVPEFPRLHDYRGIFDLRLKGTGLEQSAVADLAKNAQIDFIFLADPVTPGDSDFGIAGFTSQILFFSGGTFEVGGGELIGVNLREPIRPGLAPNDLIAAIHDQGGLAIAAATTRFASPADYALADALEVYNQREAWKAQSPSALYLRAMFSGTDRFFRALQAQPDNNLALYDQTAAGARVTMLAGLGAPDNLSVMGAKVGTLEQLMLFYTTHLLAIERDTAPLLEALKLGHSYVSFDYLGYVGEFSYYANSGDKGALMGDEIKLWDGLRLKTQLHDTADRIVMYQNGVEVASAEDAVKLEFAPKSPGAYRVEAYRKGVMWILSNPIYVR